MPKRYSNGEKATMKTVLWEGKPFEMVVRDVPKARVMNDEDAVVRVTTAALCGTDLHIYHGIFGSSEVPWAVGHEAMGIVTEIGTAVTTIKVGDRVIIPDFADPGHFITEPALLDSFTTFGFGKDFGNLGGCQDTPSRVRACSFADESLLPLGASKLPDKELLFLSDIFPTAWSCLDFAGFQPGDSVAVFGAGPVGLLCAYSALLRGASKVFSVDHVPARLEKAKSIGAIPIDFSKGSAADQILALDANGVTRSCDCIGYESLDEHLKQDQGIVIREAVKVTSSGGGIGVIGVYFAEPDSKGTPRGATKKPSISFPMTLFWEKGLTMQGGPVDKKPLVPTLLGLIESGRARPGFIVSGEFPLEEAPEAYRRFDQKLETKVLFKFPRSEEHETQTNGQSSIEDEVSSFHK